ncbi:MAG TPA: hypothetical protein VJN88_16115 [Ktedonobacterales bacterium]|nr:hypothetical protein [Ktedonobacterales bacterium]
MRFPDMKPPPVPHDCLMNGEGEQWQIAGRKKLSALTWPRWASRS